MDTGIFIPIIFFLVLGAVLITYFYFRSKEKQMMIEKGMSYEQMIEFLKTKRDPFLMLKIGIVVFFFGLGLGLGMLLEENYYSEAWIPFLLFSMTGLGFVVAPLLVRKLEKNGK